MSAKHRKTPMCTLSYHSKFPCDRDDRQLDHQSPYQKSFSVEGILAYMPRKGKDEKHITVLVESNQEVLTTDKQIE